MRITIEIKPKKIVKDISIEELLGEKTNIIFKRNKDEKTKTKK